MPSDGPARAPSLSPLAPYRSEVGENPLYDSERGRLYWVDIERGRLYWLDHQTLEHACFHQGPVVGGFTLQEDGALLLFEADRISMLDPNGGARRVLLSGIDPDMRRFNDVIADPEGRVYAGTIGKDDQRGGLYRLERDGSIECLWKGTGCANGMGFSTDLARFYWTSSTNRTIYVADYNRATGALERRRALYVAPEREGTPDGLTVDQNDQIWTARWGGGAVLRLSPEGRVLEAIGLPVPKVSCPAFGGPDLDALYLTTAGGSEDGVGLEGALFRVFPGVKGRTEFRSRIRP